MEKRRRKKKLHEQRHVTGNNLTHTLTQTQERRLCKEFKCIKERTFALVVFHDRCYALVRRRRRQRRTRRLSHTKEDHQTRFDEPHSLCSVLFNSTRFELEFPIATCRLPSSEQAKNSLASLCPLCYVKFSILCSYIPSHSIPFIHSYCTALLSNLPNYLSI